MMTALLSRMHVKLIIAVIMLAIVIRMMIVVVMIMSGDDDVDGYGNYDANAADAALYDADAEHGGYDV